MPKGHEKEPSRTELSTGSIIDPLKDKKDTQGTLNILDGYVIRTNPFGANISGDNAYRRAERIVAALHLMTNHVHESEPVRLMIRRSGIDLLDTLLDLRVGLRAPSEKGQSALALIRALISHVRFLTVSGYISPQNLLTISEALDELGSLIVISQRSTLSEQFVISSKELLPPTEDVQPMLQPHAGRKQHALRPKRPHSDQEGRGERVLEMLRLGGTLGIKDIVANLPQYSEKMVQRELAGLAHRGVVEKIGAKRWSRYRLIQKMQ